MRGNLTLLFDDFEQVHLGKDVFLFPYYLGKRYDMNVHIVYPQTPTNIHLSAEYRNAAFHPIKCTHSEKSEYATFKPYLEEHAKEIDLLMLFHQVSTTEKLCILYKTLNKRGKCYVKLDVGASIIPSRTRLKRNIFKFLHNTFQSYKFCQMVDYVSIETTEAFNRIRQSKAIHLAFGDKLHFHSNGFDEELLEELGIRINSFSKKENLLITVGQLGTLAKNTPMFLNALKLVNLHDWKVALIGPIAPEFEDEVKAFYNENPNLKEQVIFTGSISDKKELWEYYNRAKVFCLTSLWESFALVLTEAYRFGDYIVTTPVGAYRDVVLANKVGECVPVKNYKALAESLQNIIDGKTDIDVYSDEKMRQKYSMDCIVREFEL